VVLAAPRLDEHVLRLHVAVNDPVGVRFGQGRRHLIQDAQHARDAQRSFGLLQVVQRPAAQQLHRQVEDAVGRLVEVVGRDGVRVPQLRARLRLAPKTRDDGLVVHVVRVEDLQRHLASGRDLLAAEHGPEAALTDLVLDDVAVVQGAADQVFERLRRPPDGRRRRGGRRGRQACGRGRARSRA
jgi:hypothetical protein